MKIIKSSNTLLMAVVLSISANVPAAEFIYKPASPTEIAVNLQKVEGGHLERFEKTIRSATFKQKHILGFRC